MVITFRTIKLRKACNSRDNAQRKWGSRCGKLVLRRLDELKASDNLDQFIMVHSKCHPLKGDRRKQWAAYLEHPFRLTFDISNEPIPLLDDGGLDIKKVTQVRVLDVEDYHGRRAKK